MKAIPSDCPEPHQLQADIAGLTRAQLAHYLKLCSDNYALAVEGENNAEITLQQTKAAIRALDAGSALAQSTRRELAELRAYERELLRLLGEFEADIAKNHEVQKLLRRALSSRTTKEPS